MGVTNLEPLHLQTNSSRHTYCADHHWVAEEIANNTNQFEKDVLDANKRAQRIVKRIPFLVPAEMRFKIFKQLIEADQDNFEEYRSWGGEIRATIRRDHVFEDGYTQLADQERMSLNLNQHYRIATQMVPSLSMYSG